MNSGADCMRGRFVRFGFRGCPNVLGQLKDGRLLGVEVKGIGRPAARRASHVPRSRERLRWGHSRRAICTTCRTCWVTSQMPDKPPDRPSASRTVCGGTVATPVSPK